MAAVWPSQRCQGGVDLGALNPVSRRELVRKLKRPGFEGPFPGGRHQWMRRGGFRLTIPNPHRAAIDPGFVRRFLRQAGISVDEWTEALEMPLVAAWYINSAVYDAGNRAIGANPGHNHARHSCTCGSGLMVLAHRPGSARRDHARARSREDRTGWPQRLGQDDAGAYSGRGTCTH